MMKLGAQTGSLINHVASSNSSTPEITIGMGATLLHWTDRQGGTVVAWDGKTLRVQVDTATRVDSNGVSDAQQYSYAPNPAERVAEFRKDRAGNWRQVIMDAYTGKRHMLPKGDGVGLWLGVRQSFHDFSF